MVDLKHARALDAGQPIGTAVETRAQNHDLLDAIAESLQEGIIDEARARNDRWPASRPAPVNIPDDQGTQPRDMRQRSDTAQGGSQKAQREGIIEQAIGRGARGLDGPKQGIISTVRQKAKNSQS